MGGSSSTFSSSERSLSISATPDSESPAKENRQDLIKFNESVFTPKICLFSSPAPIVTKSFTSDEGQGDLMITSQAIAIFEAQQVRAFKL